MRRRFFYCKINTSIIDNEILYTSTDGNIITPSHLNFGANIISNTYLNSKGVISFDGTVTSIGRLAFSGCKSLTSITIPNSVTYIGGQAFQNCTSLTSIIIPNSVTEVDQGAFNSCIKLASVEWNPENASDYSSTFSNPFWSIYSQITSFTFGDSVRHIPAYLCYEMNNLTTITIPHSVTSIGRNAFNRCSSLTSIICKASIPPNILNSTFTDVNKSIPLMVPSESVDVYKSAEYWSEFTNIQPVNQKVNLITFTVAGYDDVYYAEEGMTWGEFINSKYNEENKFYTYDNNIVLYSISGYNLNCGDQIVYINDIIQKDYDYIRGSGGVGN